MPFSLAGAPKAAGPHGTDPTLGPPETAEGGPPEQSEERAQIARVPLQRHTTFDGRAWKDIVPHGACKNDLAELTPPIMTLLADTPVGDPRR